jgi:hypothetical protein
LRASGKLPGRLRAVGGNHPDRRIPPVLSAIDFCDDVGDEFAVGRDMRIAEEFKAEVVFRGNAAW